MTDERDQADAATEAFEAVRAEVALLRRAVERLAAERAEQPVTPDYSETLGAIVKEVRTAGKRIDTLASSAALAASPAEVAAQVARAAAQVQREGQNTLASSSRVLDDATRRVREVTASARRGRVQNWMLAGAVAIGVLLWGVLEGPVLRTAPVSWHWPEKAAARIVGLPMWDAGMKLAAVDSPASFERVRAADQLAKENALAIQACRQRAKKARDAVRCIVEIKA